MEELTRQTQRYLLSKTQDKELAADLTQEAILRLLHQDQSQIENKEAWVIRTARNLLIDHLRKANKQVTPVESPEYNQLEDELMKCQKLFISELDPESRALLTLVDLEGQNQKKVAEHFKMAYPTLRSKVQRARKQIKQRFDETCYMEYDVVGKVICCYSKTCKF